MSDQGHYTVPLSVGPSDVGTPLAFSNGPFAGKVVRTTAAELQKADAGRKFARKDKRPLDPPPVVAVRFFEVQAAMPFGQNEKEISSYADTITLALVCQVDLFPVAIKTDSERNIRDDRAMTDLLRTDPFSSLTLSPELTDNPLYSLTPRPLAASIGGIPIAPYPVVTQEASSSTQGASSDVIAYYGSYPITESSNATEILAGSRVATSVTIEHNQKPTLAFVFNDLAVKQEGSYTLRYRIFDVFSKTVEDGSVSRRVPVLASCFGGVFKIWSTKTFPGLAPSTALTKRLSLFGAAVNVRSGDRKGKGRKRRKTAHSDEREISPSTASPQSQASEVHSQGRPANISPDYFAASPDWGPVSYWASPSNPSGSDSGKV